MTERVMLVRLAEDRKRLGAGAVVEIGRRDARKLVKEIVGIMWGVTRIADAERHYFGLGKADVFGLEVRWN